MIERVKNTIGKSRVVSIQSKRRLLNKLARVNPDPVLVLGNQKTGTTAIAALLAEATGMSATLDIHRAREFGQLHTRRVYEGKVSFEDYVRRNKLAFSRNLVKDPNLIYIYDDLARHFPDSSKIFINRDPRSNIRSILNRLVLPGDLPELEESHLADIAAGWQLTLNGSWMGLNGDNYIEMLAARWNLATDTYLKNADNMTLIRYEDFCEDKAGEIYRLTERVGLEPVNDVSGKVDRQYQRRGDRRVSWVDFFGPDNLARIEHICGERMEKFGYMPSEISQ